MQRLIQHGVVDSTNERAFAALAAGEAQDGDMHVARGQSQGRGRMRRHWESATDEGLFLSYLHLPASPGPLPTAMTMAAGLALADSLDELGFRAAQLDWPNDVVVGGAKLAGILIESRGFNPAHPHFVVGIGVNVAQYSFSSELQAERAVTSLALEGLETDPMTLTAALGPHLATRFAQAMHDEPGLAAAYSAATGLLGVPVEVTQSGLASRGILRSIDLRGGLLLETGQKPLRIQLAHVHGVRRTSL